MDLTSVFFRVNVPVVMGDPPSYILAHPTGDTVAYYYPCLVPSAGFPPGRSSIDSIFTSNVLSSAFVSVVVRLRRFRLFVFSCAFGVGPSFGRDNFARLIICPIASRSESLPKLTLF